MNTDIQSAICGVLWTQISAHADVRNESFSAAALLEKAAILPFYLRWLEESLALLQENGWIAGLPDGTFRRVEPASISFAEEWARWNARKTEWACDGSLKPYVALLDSTLPALNAVLTGRMKPIEVMFPGSSMHLVEGIYRDNPEADGVNRQLANAVAAYVEERARLQPSARIRIFEAGAGTGGTTGAVLERLKNHRHLIEEYCYTDLSQAFLAHGRNRYAGENPFLSFRIVDIGKRNGDLTGLAGNYDLLIAANVLHATPRMTDTIRNAKALLRKNGVLLLNEVTRNSLLLHLTFGLLEGWWLFEDPENRLRGTPALSLPLWRRLLAGEGFRNILAPPAEPQHIGLQIIVCESDGVVRTSTAAQETEKSAEPAPTVAQATGEQAAPRRERPGKWTTIQEMVDLQAQAEDLVRRAVSKVAAIPLERIDSSQSLERYGVDSVLVVQLATELGRTFENVNTTLLFEHPSVADLARHFVTHQPDRLVSAVSSTGVSVKGAAEAAPRAPIVAAARGFRPPDEIAIVGLAGRYAGARNVGELWRNLISGTESITEIPEGRWRWQDYFAEKKGEAGHHYAKWGGFIADIDRFEPQMFHITPAEARRMDPQERLFLEVAYACIEDAGHVPGGLSRDKRVGVFVGVMNGNYPSGVSYWSIPNRLSYVFDFQGPSVAVDTACSSSLTAIHYALESIRRGECECAIAGGVNLVVSPAHYIRLSELNMLTAGPHCRPFGASADGFVPGEGVGAVLLKPLAKAREDRDHIYAIVKASALNAGGRTSGYTVPSSRAQAELIADCLGKSGIDPVTVGYIEAHGTGTALGDPIEMAAVERAFGERGRVPRGCAIGSIKANIGHCESAAGIAGLTKALLQIRHGTIAPSLHALPPNPAIDFSRGTFRVPSSPLPWPRPGSDRGDIGSPRVAGVSSFGAGGANSHIIVMGCDERRPRPVNAVPVIIPLSARTPGQLQAKARELLDALSPEALPADRFDDRSLRDIAFTLQLGREAFEWRLAFTARSLAEVRQRLDAFLNDSSGQPDLYRTRDKAAASVLEDLAEEAQLKDVVRSWWERGRHDKLLRLWVNGLDVNWDALYETQPRDQLPYRLRLPTYPFAGQRYWLERSERPLRGSESVGAIAGQSLLHRNVSSLSHQRYCSWLAAIDAKAREAAESGGILNDGAYLDLALAAVRDSSSSGDAPSQVLHFEAIEWGSSGARGVAGIDCIFTSVFPGEGDTVSFEIHSRGDTAAGGEGTASPEVFCRGEVRVARSADALAGPRETWNYAGEAVSLAATSRDRLFDGLLQTAASLLSRRVFEGRRVTLLQVRAIDVDTEALQAQGSVYFNFRSQRQALPGDLWSIHVTESHGRTLAVLSDIALSVSGARVPPTAQGRHGIREMVVNRLKGLIAEYAQLRSDEISEVETFDTYGIDSLMVNFLNDRLAAHFDALPRTLLFEHRTLQSVAAYLVDGHFDGCARWVGAAPVAREHTGAAVGSAASRPVLQTLERGGPKAVAMRPGRHRADEDIAIVGLDCVFPDAADARSFWRNLQQGRSSITQIPASRWSLEGFYEPDVDKSVRDGRSYSKWGAFLEQFAEFDALFFNISPREAIVIDPQERIFIQSCWKVLEAAGYTRKVLAAKYQSRVAVFVGVTQMGFELHGPELWRHNDRTLPHTNFGSIANRVSYLLDLKGPSMPIDTHCSASLTAIHEACEHLRSGACDMAIAGGVNLFSHPATYVDLSTRRMLSADGVCRAFGEGANGFVPGEGVATVLLKTLSKAVADRDHIHAVIKGTSINHGGKTSGYTVPSPEAQARAVRQAIETAGVRASDIGYIEAHGTGTSLGDPIEIDGLTRAFAIDTAERQFCAIGSVKTNIGHLESAAGIAGLIKIVLQMQHQQIAPTLNCAKLNPAIDFASTPFLVQQELAPWPAISRESADGRRFSLPRTAGVSSFGAGGANAHVIVQEYQEASTEHAAGTPRLPVVVPISARTSDVLVQQARDLLLALDDLIVHGGDDAVRSLADIGYTLQVGREAMPCRFVMLVHSVDELRAKLTAFVQGDERIPAAYIGKDGKLGKELHAFTEDAQFQILVQKWFDDGKYLSVLELWAKGLDVEWSQLHSGHGKDDYVPRRISLPTYPFSRKKHWFDVPGVVSASGHRREGPVAITSVAGEAAAPMEGSALVHSETRAEEGARYTSVFDGSETFLRDHCVQNQKILPAVAYLEMAAEALLRSKKRSIAALPEIAISICGVDWRRPIVVDAAPVEVSLALTEATEGAWRYEVHTSGATGGADLLHSAGTVRELQSSTIAAVDMRQLRRRCSARVIDGPETYRRFAALGIEYGHSHRVVQEIFRGEDEVLARLQVPADLVSTVREYVLQPGLADGALQASIALMDSGTPEQLLLPFQLQELRLYRVCQPRMWAHVRLSDPLPRAGERPLRFALDIDLLSEDGQLCASFRRLTGKVRQERGRASSSTLLFVPRWERAPAFARTPRTAAARRLILLGALEPNYPTRVREGLSDPTCEIDHVDCGAAGDDLATQTISLLERFSKKVAALAAKERRGDTLLQAVVTQADALGASGLFALLASAAREMPWLNAQVIEIETWPQAEDLISLAREVGGQPGLTRVRYRNGHIETRVLREITADLVVPSSPFPWRADGVHLVTGGGGAISRILIPEILRKAPGSTIILAGRREGESLADWLRVLSGAQRVRYMQCDVARPAAVRELIASIERDFGTLNGIVHCAGLLRDNYIWNKADGDLAAVAAPKIHGACNLDRATRHLPLDYFVLFSSLVSETGNAGQTDYAAANAFLDTYAGYRNNLVGKGEASGRTLAIDWPNWKDGGMRVDKAVDEYLERTLGLAAMSSAAGIEVLDRAWASGESQVVVASGDAEKIRPWVACIGQDRVEDVAEDAVSAAQARQQSVAADVAVSVADAASASAEKIVQLLAESMTRLLRIPIEEADSSAELSAFGFDSVSLIEFTNELNQRFSLELAPTIFFEHPTLGSLAEFLAETSAAAFANDEPATQLEPPSEGGPEIALLVAMESTSPARTALTLEDEPVTPPVSSGPRVESSRVEAVAQPSGAAVAVAIIGMSGRFPLAGDVEAFWENLVRGVDCVSTIPEDRADREAYFGGRSDEPLLPSLQWGAFIAGVCDFDPLFFNISPHEAELMDPHQRLLMMETWKAVEDAGYSAKSLAGSDTAVYMGTGTSGYSGLVDHSGIAPEGYGAIARVPSVGPARMSFFMDLHGPCEAIETACSSALVAIHRGVQSLSTHECRMAIVGGVNVIVSPKVHISYARANMLSPDGRCRTFSSGANGYVRGEGVGVLVLKRLDDAERDGDHIYGVIRGSGVNHGGRATSFTAPSSKAQAALLQDVYSRAGIDPRTISYIEAHGTGTALGDPVEVEALKAAFGSLADRFGGGDTTPASCGIGAVKTQIGHLELAAGVAGLIKVLLQMKHGTLVRSLHCEEVNPYIDLSDTPFYLVNETTKWSARKDRDGMRLPRRAGVSSFGIGGVNAHVIVEEYLPPRAPRGAPDGSVLICLSARTPGALQRQAENLASAISTAGYRDADLRNIAYTLQIGRDAMSERLAVVVGSVASLVDKLRAFVDGDGAVADLFRGSARLRHQTGADVADLSLGTIAGAARGNAAELMRLARAWSEGRDIEWSALYKDQQALRITLPTYPFQLATYWTGATAGSPPVVAGPRAATGEPAPVLHTLVSEWLAQPARLGTASAASFGTALVVGGTSDEHEALASVCTRLICCSIDDRADEARLAASLSEQLIDTLILISPALRDDAGVLEDEERQVLAAFHVFKELLRAGYASKPLRCYALSRECYAVHASEPAFPAPAALHGYLRSLANEYRNWTVTVVDLDARSEWPLAELASLPTSRQSSANVLRYSQWYELGLIELENRRASSDSLYRHGGVYIVIGGAGGIGSAWSEYMIARYQATIIWIGRTPQNAQIDALRSKVAHAGLRPEYVCADAADRDSFVSACHQIRKRHPRIHGVIHSAIVLADQSLAQMSERQLLDTLRSKADTSVHVGETFKGDDLDFLLFFSSSAAYFSPAGQSNYVAACSFSDAYAVALARRVSFAVRVLNWSFWGSVGVVATKEFRDRMARAGMASIELPEALTAIETALSLPRIRMAVIKVGKPDVLASLPIAPYKAVAASERARVSITRVSDILNTTADGVAPSLPEEFERDVAQIVLATLEALHGGLDEPRTLDEMARNAGIRPKYVRWLRATADLLVGNKLLTCRDGRYSRASESATFDSGRVRDLQQALAQWESQAGTGYLLPMLRRALSALPQILTGSASATDVLFPGGTLELVEDLYRSDPFGAVCHRNMARIVAGYCEAFRAAGRPERVRILEIGAGTGSASEPVLAALEPFREYIDEYTFTDISQAFLSRARLRFGRSAPYLRCRLLDIERSPGSQGISPGSYDLVVASNVLHATANLARALENTRALLKSAGGLLLEELVRPSLLAHLTFGLLDGWWRFEDEALRLAGGPIVSMRGWARLLSKQGFRNVSFPMATRRNGDRQLILCESDGIIVVDSASAQVRPDSPALESPSVLADEGALTSRTPLAEPTQDAAELDRVVEDVILDLLATELKVDRATIDRTDPFANYGVDSISGITLVQRLNESLQIELNATSLFDHSSVRKLAAYILAHLKPVAPRSAPPGRRADELGPVVPLPQMRGPSVTEAVRVEARSGRVAAAPSAAEAPPLEIAIVGLSGRFPQSEDVRELWRNLVDGRALTSPVTRWDLQALAARNGQADVCNAGGFLSGIDEFDPGFFHISETEARYMDPQQRLFLQEGWSALEDAGYSGPSIQNARCGVYVGCGMSDYSRLYGDDAPPQALWGQAASIIPARIAYHLDLHGPAVAIDTACSSGLAAVQIAALALRSGEIDLAVAGGVFVQSTPAFHIAAQRAGMLSRAGRVRAFDREADGFVPAEGVGAVVLKRAAEAIRDKDHVYGVIIATGMNQDGRSNGITAPSAEAQEALQTQVYRDFHVAPDSIQLVEANGTASRLGDPIEIRALTRSFRKRNDRAGYCAIGSIKTNIGHCVHASGVASLIKVLMAFRHRFIPASLHFDTLNPEIDLEGGPFYVNAAGRPWLPPAEGKRRAAINSFGFGGTNVHMVLEEPDTTERPRNEQPACLILLSARTAEALQQRARELARFCLEEKTAHCGDVAYTLALGRQHFEYRLACVVENCHELAQTLSGWLTGHAGARVATGYWSDHMDRPPQSIAEEARQEIERIVQQRRAPESARTLAALGSRYVAGCPLDLERLFRETGARISLPTYPFAREKYWIPSHTGPSEVAPASLVPVLRVDTATPQEPIPVSTSAAVELTTHDGVNGPGDRAGPALRRHLKMLVAEVVGCTPERLDSRRSFESLGVDSLMSVSLVTRLQQAFGDLPRTLLFEQRSVQRLARYFMERYPETTASLFGGPGRSLETNDSMRVVNTGVLDGDLPVTPVQELFCNRNLVAARTSTAAALDLGRDVRADVLQEALLRVVQRHSILRTVYLRKDGKLVANVIDADQFRPTLLQCPSAYPDADNDQRRAEIARLVREEELHRYDVSSLPLFRASLHQGIPGHAHLILGMHHVVTDGTSYALLLQDLMAIYDALLAGTEPTLEPAIQFADFARVLREHGIGRGLYRKNYDWNLESVRNLRVLTFPTDGGAAGNDAAGERIVFFLKSSVAQRVRRRASEVQVSPNSLCLSATALFLQQLNQAEDEETFVKVLSNMRLFPGTRKMLGPIVDVGIMRLRICSGITLRELLQEVQEQQGAMLLHSMNSVAAKIALRDSVARVSAETFHSMPLYSFENYPGIHGNTVFNVWTGDDEPRAGSRYSIRCETDFTPFSVRFVPRGDEMAVSVTYATATYSRARVDRYIDGLTAVLQYLATVDVESSVDEVRRYSRALALAALGEGIASEAPSAGVAIAS